MSITAATAKFKYGGNKDAAHRHQIAEHLSERGGRSDDAARTHLLRRLL